MKVIDAVWEKRNLGVDTVEFEIEPGDTGAIINDIILAEKQYNVVKIPSVMPDMHILIQQYGYRYIESSIGITIALKNYRVNSDWSRYVGCVASLPMDAVDIQRCFDEIESGIFNTDRIYNDPQFGAKQSARRYINWIKSDIKCGTALYKIVYEGQTVGFYLLKDMGKGIYDTVLGGIYKEWLSSPLAINIVYQPILEAKRLGLKKFKGHLSSNNIKSLRLRIGCGFDIFEILYVFVKHK